jgi:hypothetical protein
LNTLTQLRTLLKANFLLLLLGISLAVGVNGLLESQFENEILSNIAQKITDKTKGQSEEDQIDTAIALCYALQASRTEILGGDLYHSFKANNFAVRCRVFTSARAPAAITVCLRRGCFRN